MLEKPPLEDTAIRARLEETYGLPVAALAFLPIGNDASGWVYRVTATDGQRYFLKVRDVTFRDAGVLVPEAFHALGLKAVVAPLSTIVGTPWANLDDYRLILYPFIDGVTAMETGLSDRQWTAFGAFMRQLHSTELPPELAAQVRRETFAPRVEWTRVIRPMQTAVRKYNYEQPHKQKLGLFWRERVDEIEYILARTRAIGQAAKARKLPFVLCHSDIHTANILVSPAGELFVVDWDQPIYAPKERDLSFYVGDDRTNPAHLAPLFQGYGPYDIDPWALAYYRYEWVVQEIAEYGERVFLADNIGDETRADAVEGFMQLFAPGDVVAAAYALEPLLTAEQP